MKTLIGALLLSSLLGTRALAQCEYPKDFVETDAPSAKNDIAHYHWIETRDADSEEFIKALHLLYKNGDYAVVEHKYCSLYNFSLAYYRSAQAPALDAARIGALTAEHFQRYAKIKADFSSPLSNIITTGLGQAGFPQAKSIDHALPTQEVNLDQGIEYLISYQDLGDATAIHSAMFGYYWGVGGL